MGSRARFPRDVSHRMGFDFGATRLLPCFQEEHLELIHAKGETDDCTIIWYVHKSPHHLRSKDTSGPGRAMAVHVIAAL